MTTILLGMALMKLRSNMRRAPTRNGIMLLHSLSQRPGTTWTVTSGAGDEESWSILIRVAFILGSIQLHSEYPYEQLKTLLDRN